MRAPESPVPPGPETIPLRPVLFGALGLTVMAVLIWLGSGAELRGYGQPSLPGGVPLATEPTAAEAELAVLMSEGVELLYEQRNTEAAVVSFTEVLDRNPAHYGARYQVAKALEANGRLMDALHAWRRFEAMADSISALPQLGQAEGRVADLEAQVQYLEQQMIIGVDLIRKGNDPAGALAYFDEVVTRWPSHYGARYQRAVALEKSGELEEAKQAWVRFLESAEAIKEGNDIQAATDALERLGSPRPQVGEEG